MKFPIVVKIQDNKDKLLEECKKIILEKYSQLFLSIKGINKNEILNIIIFSLIYLIPYLFFMRFPYNTLNIFNIRFVMDSYHIILFLLHGMFYSDIFLVKNFERYFTTKFLEYT